MSFCSKVMLLGSISVKPSRVVFCLFLIITLTYLIRQSFPLTPMQKVSPNMVKCLKKTYLHMNLSSCAVVFSSGFLLNSSLGREIDSKGDVIRFNDAPEGGQFAADVGARTTFRLLGSAGAQELIHRIKTDKTFRISENVTFLSRYLGKDTIEDLKKFYPNNSLLLMERSWRRVGKDAAHADEVTRNCSDKENGPYFRYD